MTCILKNPEDLKKEVSGKEVFDKLLPYNKEWATDIKYNQIKNEEVEEVARLLFRTESFSSDNLNQTCLIGQLQSGKFVTYQIKTKNSLQYELKKVRLWEADDYESLCIIIHKGFPGERKEFKTLREAQDQIFVWSINYAKPYNMWS